MKKEIKYLTVKEWDPEYGYLVVDVLHDTLGIVEDYIDLLPMLDNLYIDTFGKKIKMKFGKKKNICHLMN